ncbi:kinase-like domain-containing protein, partial [Mycena floridula]
IDAIRVKDGQKVVLKIVFDNTKEREILQTFSEPLFRNNPRNHCVPVLDTIEFPGKQYTIIVLPFLISIRASPHCMREVINFMRQTLQGLKFMHDQNIAHRDISKLNIMMTGGHVIPSEHHFVSFSNMYSLKSGLLVPCKPQQHLCRVSRLRYFFIDFGLSDKHPDGQEQARTTGRFGQVRVTPELSDDVPYNPFKSDILQLGRIFKDLFPLKFPDLHDFDVLADRMTKTKAEDRPNAKEALELFEEIVSSMPK